MRIITATLDNLEEVTTLFNAYRVFYEQKSDMEGARNFLKERIEQSESIIFLAYLDEKAVGFTQLYPMFSSVSMQRMLVLNDLFVDSSVRGKGVGAAILNHAKAFAKANNLKGLALETAEDNPAQKLYERLGWKRDTGYYHYFYSNQ